MSSEIDVTLDRSSGIGSSDAYRIAKGEWLDLYEEKMGLKESEDLSDNFRVQLGSWTEPFHIAWLRDKEGFDIVVPMKRFETDSPVPMYAHLDGLIDGRGHVEVKHTNQFASADQLLETYAPQLHHVMHILGTEECLFSYIGGNNPPNFMWVRKNTDYMNQLLEMEEAFWWHVKTGTQPEEPSFLDVPDLVIDNFKPYDYEQHNEWVHHAADYTDNKDAAAAFEQAKKGLKSLVPDDASRVSGAGVTIVRDKRGALRFK